MPNNNRSLINGLIILYTLLSITNLMGFITGNKMLSMISKPLLMPLLIVWFILSTRHHFNAFAKWLVAGFIFSWFGDLALMKEADGPQFFILGLASFLFAHLSYIRAFIKTPYRHKLTIIKSKPWLLLVFLVFEAGLLYLLFPYLADMKIPVVIYATVIMLMSIYALNRYGLVNNTSYKLILSGALIFMLSDTTIALNKFYYPFKYAGLCIMFTYLLAQYLIAKGGIEQVKEESASRL